MGERERESSGEKKYKDKRKNKTNFFHFLSCFLSTSPTLPLSLARLFFSYLVKGTRKMLYCNDGYNDDDHVQCFLFYIGLVV